MKPKKIAVMAGTTEGRLLAQFLEQNNIAAFILVATEYGGKVLPHFEYCRVHTGRFDAVQLKEFFVANGITHVYDATHPYAKVVTGNCKSVCRQLHIPYRRILRENIAVENYLPSGQFSRFDSLSDAVDFLSGTEGKIFVTTGGKETDVFTGLPDFGQRIVLRILPDECLKERLIKRGFWEEQIIMGQGPFGVAYNSDMMKRFHVRYLITKESGVNGGLAEKLVAAKEQDVFVLLIKRPEETGITLEEAYEELAGYE